jgi:hypothetical protein
MAGELDIPTQSLLARLGKVPVSARRLFCVTLQQILDGPLRSKAAGVATAPEILEACGVDVDGFYALLAPLKTQGLLDVSVDYPFEEIRLTAESQVAVELAQRCHDSGVPVEAVFVNLQPHLLTE